MDEESTKKMKGPCPYRSIPQSILPLGSRFDPTDEEVLGFYLQRKVSGNLPIQCDFIATLDLYVAGAEPWSIHPGSKLGVSSTYLHIFPPMEDTHWFYCYAHTTNSSSGSCRKVGASGMWHANKKPITIMDSEGEILGYKTYFVFEGSTDGTRGVGGWEMDEFSLCNKSPNNDNYVLCRVRRTSGQQPNEED